MNKSYSKIRHIQESNLRLEKRFLNETSNSDAQSYEDINREHIIKSIVKNITGTLSKYFVPGSGKMREDDSVTEVEFYLAIYKDSHNFPEEISSEVEKKTKDLEKLITYLKDRIENGEFSNYSDKRRSVETSVEYVGEKNNDYVFLVKYKDVYK